MDYRLTKELYAREIGRAKARGWKEMLEKLDRDLWGRPYKIVRQKLKTSSKDPVTESTDPALVENIVDTLFPEDEERRNGREKEGNDRGMEENEENKEEEETEEITDEELISAIRKIKTRKASGISGIPGETWKIALSDEEFRGKYKRLINRCLKEGKIPDAWKIAKLVLILKPGKEKEDPAAYRPICLLEEENKIFERVLVERMRRDMEGKGPDLSEEQYGFRKGKSTNNALEEVVRIVKGMVDTE